MSRFSILTPVFNTPPGVAERTIASVRAQRCRDWEWVVVDDHSTNPDGLAVFEMAAHHDARIKIVRRGVQGGISAASNTGLAQATGEWLVLLDHDDELAVTALASMRDAIEANPSVDYLYSNEDKITPDGVRFGPFVKPSVFSPERLRWQNYPCHLSTFRTALVRQVGGFRPEFDGAQDWDLILRVTEKARRVVHVPEILYHWRTLPGSTAGDAYAKPYAFEAGRRAVQEHLDRVGISGHAVHDPTTLGVAVKRRLDPSVKVSAIIPTCGTTSDVWGRRTAFVVDAVRSLFATTVHAGVEVLVVFDDSTPTVVLDELAGLDPGRVKLVRFRESFNFSRKCNVGAKAASGEVLLFLNDDIEAITTGWLETLATAALEDRVGVVGARLLYEDGTVQHGGHYIGDSTLTHGYHRAGRLDAGYANELKISREVSGNTAACVAVSRTVFDLLGGFDERLPNSFNDVALSLRARELGLRNVWCADAELFHFESKSRNPTVTSSEIAAIFGRYIIPATPDPFMPMGRVR